MVFSNAVNGNQDDRSAMLKRCMGCGGWGVGLVQMWGYCNHCTRYSDALFFTRSNLFSGILYYALFSINVCNFTRKKIRFQLERIWSWSVYRLNMPAWTDANCNTEIGINKALEVCLKWLIRGLPGSFPCKRKIGTCQKGGKPRNKNKKGTIDMVEGSKKSMGYWASNISPADCLQVWFQIHLNIERTQLASLFS